jgi:outer membrane protein OmpA-like peptidoglycan-associated protein
MSFNLVDAVNSIFNNGFAAKAASLVGESETNVKNAMGGIVPSLLTGLLHKAGSADPSSLLKMAKDASQSGIMGNLGSSLSNSSILTQGSEMLKGLFGDRLGNVSSLISKFSGIQESSASSLMNAAAPAVMGVLGKHATENNLSAGGLLSLLNSQKDHIMSALPSGLNLAGALGLGSLSGIGSKLSGKLSELGGAASHASSKIVHVAEYGVSGSRNWLPWILGAIAVIVLLMFLGKGCNGTDKTAAVVPIDTVAKTIDSAVVQPVVAAVRESLKVKLPDGVELDAYKGGIEDELVGFLNNPSSVAGKDVWFDFDNLNFKTGSSDITDESMVQVKNISAILKAYPKLKIKIGGYTDKTGDSLSNIKLSQSRAIAVVTQLKTDGASAGQLVGAEGYGSQFAKAAADAPDAERQKDRRIAVSVRAK